MNRKNRNVIIGIVAVNLLLLVLYLLLTTQGKNLYQADSGKRTVMGTYAQVLVEAADKQVAEQCVEAAFGQIESIDSLMSYYNPDSEISRINKKAFGESVPVGPATYNLIKRSVEFSEITDGAFDITVGPLMDLWRAAADANTTPTGEQLESAIAKVGYKKIIFDDARSGIRFSVEGMRLDLGGIAKGFAADKATEVIKSNGGLGAMVDMGGNIRCFGTTLKSNKDWLIGLQNPDLNSPVQNLMTLKLADQSVSTSGNYWRFFQINGNRHSHILEPASGRSAEGLSSVTIITEQATDADALSTAVTVMGAKKGLEFIEKIPNTEAILITQSPEYRILKTKGMDAFIK